MEVLHPHCAGLDVHKDSVVACIRHMVEGKVTTMSRLSRQPPGADGPVGVAFHRGRHAHRHGSDGVYWKPVWHILSDGEFELILANAAT